MRKSTTFSPVKGAMHAKSVPFYMTKGFRCFLAVMLAMNMLPISNVSAFAENEGETPSAETPATGLQTGGETLATGETPSGEQTGGDATGTQTGGETPATGETPSGTQTGGETPATGETPSGETPATGETPGEGVKDLTDDEAQAICPSITITSAANYATTKSEGTYYLTPNSEAYANTKTITVATTAGTGGDIQNVVIKDNNNVVSAPEGVVTIGDNNAHVITVEVTDAAGNKTILDAEGKTTLTIGDKTYNGTSTIKDGNGNTLSVAKFAYNIFGQSSATDDYVETSVSQSKKDSTTRYINNGGKVALTVKVKSVDENVSIDGTFNNSAWSKSFDADKQEVTFTRDITAPVTGPIQYSVSGHGVTTELKTIYAYSLKSDIQDPVISFSTSTTSTTIEYRGQIPTTDPVYQEALALLSKKTDVEITVSDDQIVDKDSIKVYVNNEVTPVNFEPSGKSYKGTVTVENKESALASYYIEVTASDDAGRTSKKYMTKTIDEAEKLFLIVADNEAPTATCDNAPSIPQSAESYELKYTVKDNFAFDPTKTGWGNYVVKDNGNVLGSDKVTWTQDPLDLNKWVATVDVDGEGTHAVTFDVTDAAGNPASASNQTVILDKTAPTMEIKGTAGFFDEDQKVRVEVTDATFGLIADNNTAIAKIKSADVKDGEYSDTYTDAVTLKKGDFKEEGGKWVAEYTLGAEGSYKVEPVAFSDAAGNSLDVSAVTPLSGVVIDKTAPKVTVEFNDSFAQSYNGVDYFYDSQVVSVSVADMNFVPPEGFEKSGVDDRGVAVYTKKAYATFDESEGNTISVSFTDEANHTTSGSYGTETENLVFKAGENVLSGSSFTIDKTAPEVTRASVGTKATNSYDKSGYTEAFFNTNTALTVEVSDNLGIAPKSGAKNAGYQVEGLALTDGINSTLDDAAAAAKSATITIDLADANDESGSNEMRSSTLVTVTDLAGNYRTWSIDENGTYVLVREGNPQKINNTGVDPLTEFNNGHPSALIQDTIAPSLSLSAPENGSYLNYHPTVTLGITEMNFRYIPKATQILTEEKSNSYGGDGTTVYSASMFSGSAGNYTYTSRELEDGHYVLNASVTDAAGNKSNTQSAEFTVDTIAPTIEVAWDNNDVRNGKYYNRGRTATITIVERNFEGGSASWTIDAPGASIGGWSSNGDVHTATVTFSNDGEYTMSVSGQDAAGNALPTYTADPFVVDQTAPRVEFGGVSNDTAYADTVAPTISFIDEANLDTNGNSHQLSGSKNGVVSYENGTSESSNTLQTVAYSDFQHVPGYDDIYTITATAKDLAGNTADGTITFSVNRYGSNFRVVDVEQYEDNDGILGERQDVQFEEINVSGIDTADSIISIARGASEATNLKEGKGYEITSGTSSDSETNGWTRYVYTVKEENFDKDGKYTLSISSKTSVSDAEQFNTSVSYFDRYYDLLTEEEKEKEDQYKANCELSFILDETAPEIVSLNIADGAVYDASTYQGQFTVVEDTGLKTDNGVVVTVDGKEVNVESDKYGNYTFNVEAASFTSRNLNIVVTDKAGHQATVGNYDGNHAAEKVEFHVTTNILELHLPIVIVVAVIVIIAAAGGIVAIRRKMKQLDEAEAVS